MTMPKGVSLTPIPDAAPLLRALLAGGLLTASLPKGVPGESFRYAVLQCTDTFVWGISGAAGWLWSSDADTELRHPRLETLLEARIFGPEAEILAWRSSPASATFAGRLAVDDNAPAEAWLAPLDREAAFVGSKTPLSNTHFGCWTTGGGKVTIAPCGSRVRVREYLSVCPETGVLRIAMTRFLEVI